MSENGESFEDGISHLLIMLEELRRSLPSTSFAEKQQQHDGDDGILLSVSQPLEGLVGRLDYLGRKAADDPHDDVKRDLYKAATTKVLDVHKLVIHRIVQAHNKIVFDEDQGQVARIAELCLIVGDMAAAADKKEKPDDETSKSSDTIASEVIPLYAEYQKQVLRQRAKPSIAHLATCRMAAASANNPIQQQHILVQEEDDDDDAISQPHSHAVTTILGQASSLIHPLIMWNVPPESPIGKLCHESVVILDDQAQALVKTVCEWFEEDKKLDEWMKQSADQATAENAPSAPIDLATLDSLVDEMAYCCQVMARYQALIQDATTKPTTISQQLLPELTWKYASLERFLGLGQLASAVKLATPVNIILGLPVRVPSVVEDAQYLSTRALDRALSTRNAQAMGTVAHALTHFVWSTEHHGGVYTALVEYKGCWGSGNEDTMHGGAGPVVASQNGHTAVATAPKSGDFASALLDALDQDLKSTKSPPPSAPTSGGFLGISTLMAEEHLQRLDMQLCALNGLHSASKACVSLASALDAWMEEEEEDNGKNGSKNSMISLAREELQGFSRAYQELLESQSTGVILEWCGKLDEPTMKGKCLHALRDFFGQEQYELDSPSFHKAEADHRLEVALLEPIKSSKLMSQLNKCETDVGLVLCKHFSTTLTDLIVESLWQNEKRFTDWGSLLLSKQVRMLQTLVISELLSESTATPTGQERHLSSQQPSFISDDKWERLSQVVTVLQLERPSDWNIYQATSVLTVTELEKTLSLRVDFSKDAIQSLCASLK